MVGVKTDRVTRTAAKLYQLTAMAHNAPERLRRFTSEVTRPRGVWSRHIPLFKDQPELALALLDELAPDASRYVSTSLGNWLNDAGRSRPWWMLKVNFEYISLLWQSLIGIAMVVMALILMAIGIFWMRKVVEVEV